ncbi:MAG: PAS domain S-box protein, partial [Planctomycetota bacterium]
MNWMNPRDHGDVPGPLGEARRAAYRDELHALILRLSHEFIRVEQDGLEDAIRRALETLGRFVGASSCYLFEFDTQMSSASKRYEWRAASVPSTIEAFARVTSETMRTLFPLSAAGRTVRVNSLDELDRDASFEREKLEALSIGAFLFVPLKLGERVVGLVGFDQHGGGRVWTDEHELLLQLAADMLVQAIERRGARDRLEFHVNNAPLGVIEWGPDWNARRWSPTAEKIFGWAPREVIDRSWADWTFVHEQDLPRVTEATRRLIEGEEDSNICVNRNHTRDGRVITCEWFNSVLRDHAGRVVSILSFVQDVTQAQRTQRQLVESRGELEKLHAELQERADEALRESELRHGTLAEHATDMISCHDLDGTYRYASQASEALIGYTPAELWGVNAFELIHPDDLAEIRAGHETMLRTAGSWVATYRLRHKTG